MSEGLGFRIAITVVAAAQAMVAAALGFGEIIPQQYKFGLVVVSAGLAVVANQLPSWQSAPHAERELRAKNVD